MTAILGPNGQPFTRPKQKPQRVRASYDAASTTRHNERHWANADSLSGQGAASPEVRKKIRERARYEAQESNSYAKGMVLTLANDTIGTGPRLQVTSIPGRMDATQLIEREFMLWCYESRLAEKLRTLRVSKAVDGEAFAAFVTNPSLKTRVQLDLALIECDRVKSPWWSAEDDELNADGIEFDPYGNPKLYRVLREHPGSTFFTEYGKFDTVPAEDMVHLFRCDRPGQRRGISEITPALPLFAHLRAFTLATVHAARAAANYAGVLYTDDSDAEEEIDAIPGESIEVDMNSLLVLDRGRKLEQLKAEHPTTTFEMFKREILREIARCLNMPYNVAAGDSSKYNYASGRLDHQTYDRSIKIEQDYFGGACLDRTFMRWLEEAMLIPGYLPEGLPPFAEWNWVWFFDGRPHVDPLKEAAAATTLINGLLQTEKAYFAERGLDWEEQERQMATELGVTVAEFRKLKAVKRFVTGSAQEEMVRQLLELEAREEEQADSEEFANAD